MTNVLIPRFDGATLSLERKEALLGRSRNGSATTTHAVRDAFQRSQSLGAEPRDWGQSEDSGEVAEVGTG